MDSLHRRAERERRRDDLEDVEAASVELGRLRGLLADLLELGRLGAQMASLRRRRVDLAVLAQEAADGAGQEGCEVRVEGPGRLVVEGDSRRLGQALRDLVTEARESVTEGVPVVVELRGLDEAGGRCAQVTVRGEAPGVPATASQSHPSSRSLGLYVARAIADAHGGELEIEPGQGASVYRLRLPIE